MLLEQQNKIPEARARYERVIQTYPRAPIAANNLAWIYAENGGNLDRALELAQSAKAELPESAEVSDTIGWIFYRKKMFPQAVTSLKEAAARAPDNVMMRYHLGLAFAERVRLRARQADPLGRLESRTEFPARRRGSSRAQSRVDDEMK